MSKNSLLSISFNSNAINLLRKTEGGELIEISVKINPVLSIGDNLDLFFAENLNIYNHPYTKVSLISFTNNFLLAPQISEELEANYYSDYLDPNFIGQKEKKNNLNFTDTVNNFQCNVIYSIEEQLYKSISDHFDNFYCNHSSSLFLNNIFCSDQPELHLIIQNDSILIAVFKESKLLLCNLFNGKSDEDCLYHILNTVAQLKLEPASLLVYFYGFFEEKKNLRDKLKKIFPHINFGENDKEIRKHFLSLATTL